MGYINVSEFIYCAIHYKIAPWCFAQSSARLASTSSRFNNPAYRYMLYIYIYTVIMCCTFWNVHLVKKWLTLERQIIYDLGWIIIDQVLKVGKEQTYLTTMFLSVDRDLKLIHSHCSLSIVLWQLKTVDSCYLTSHTCTQRISIQWIVDMNNKHWEI